MKHRDSINSHRADSSAGNHWKRAAARHEVTPQRVGTRVTSRPSAPINPFTLAAVVVALGMLGVASADLPDGCDPREIPDDKGTICGGSIRITNPNRLSMSQGSITEELITGDILAPTPRPTPSRGR